MAGWKYYLKSFCRTLLMYAIVTVPVYLVASYLLIRAGLRPGDALPWAGVIACSVLIGFWIVDARRSWSQATGP
jgi:hypothetical protein